MHGGTRLPSQCGPRRGLPGPAYGAISQRPLFTPPPSTAPPAGTVRLPSLTGGRPSFPSPLLHSSPPTAGSAARGEAAAAAAQASRMRYTSSLKRSVRPTPGRGEEEGTTGANSSPSTTEASVSSPQGLPASPHVGSAAPTSSSAPPCPPTSSSLPLTTSSSIEGLLEKQQYADLYLVLSSQLPRTPRRPSAEDARTMRLLGYRAICSAGLLHFKESAEDGMACLDIRRRLRLLGCTFASADALEFNAQVDECVLRALAVSERYEQAEHVAAGLEETPVVSSSRSQSTTASTTTAGAATSKKPTALTWHRATPHIVTFRSAVAAQQWREALAAVDGHAEAATCVRASPLCAMLAFVHLEAGHPMTARALLLSYLADLPEPPTWEALAAAPSEHEQLWDSFRSHYVFATTLLAKASVMSGSAYLNIAAALLQRCLCVLPLYTPARVLGEFVLAYEVLQDTLESAMTKQDFNTALTVSAQMLRMPEVTARLQGEVLLARTQVHWMRGLPLEVVREASQCVAADPECAMAFRLRAAALEAMQHVAEAVADRATATRLKPKVEALFGELTVQRRSYEAAVKASEAQRRSFTAFASSAPAPTHRRGCSRDGAAAFSSSPEGSRSEAGVSPKFAKTVTPAAPTHYAVLGVSPQATSSDIRHRYRHLTLQCHPDRVVGASEERREQAAEEFKRVSHAYSILSDVQLRCDYDASLRHLF